jgi:indole-3-glycerol phosphate synthase
LTTRNAPDILQKIVAVKREDVERLKSDVPLSALRERMAAQANALDFAGALRGDSVRVIAEVKKASPSRGVLRADFDPVEIATVYVENGAAAISVLTNVEFFQGSIGNLETVGSIAHPKGVPVLRKEFIFDPYQVYEARAYGADALLLIVAMLSAEELASLMALTAECGMQALVEVHDEDELRIALDAGADIIGINNRDLRTFVTDLAVTERLASRVPAGKVIISESGIATRDDVKRVRKAGANAILVGESLVVSDDIGAKLRELL